MKEKIGSNWWTRNWKWFVPTGCLGSIFLFVGFVAIVFTSISSMFKSSDVYKQALVNTRKNAEVIEAIGGDINEGYFTSGKIEISGPSGEADFAIPISGSKGEGHVYVVATKKSGKWIFETLEVEIEGETERINLIDE